MFRPKFLYVGLVLSLLFVFAPAVLGQDVAAPRIIDTSPLSGEELGLDRSVIFTFDRPMDSDHSDNQFSVTPEIGGTWAWDDAGQELTFAPEGNYGRDTDYLFSVFATDVDGQAMAEPYTLRLLTVGFLEITGVLPEPDTDLVDVDSTITVIFNRPVVPLVSLNDQANLPNPVEIFPETSGRGSWLNTSIYIFEPDTVLLGGVEYLVTVPTGLQGISGAVLDEPYSFRFTTAPPEVVSMAPRDGEIQVALNTEITVNFTQPMDPATENGIYVEGPNGVRPQVQYEWSEDRQTVFITPIELLSLDSLYDVIVSSSGVHSASGASLQFDYRQSFQTVPYPAIVRTEPNNGGVNVEPYGGLRIFFNAPIDETTLEDKVTVDPEPWREYESYYYSYDNSYSMFFDTEPSTTYTITVAPGIADPYGNTINESTVVTYTTAPYGPEVFLNSPAFVGLYNGYNPSTRLFVNHRNVTSLNFELYQLDLPTLASLTGPEAYRTQYEFFPASNQLIRRWSVPVESDLNQRAYELIFLTSGSAADSQCPNTPPTQLAVGVTAQVTLTDPRPSRVRDTPSLSGNIVTEFDPGVTFEVRDGPVCADGYLWWQIFNADTNTEGWMAEGNFENYFIEPTVAFPTNVEDAPALAPGVYYLFANSPETAAYGFEPQRHTLLVATANITMKFSPDEIMAWVTDMQTGQPISAAPLVFYDDLFNPIATATTDTTGLARVEMPHLDNLYTTLYVVLQTDQHFGYVVSEFSQGIDPWRFEIPGDYQPEQYSVYLYTDRPIYRPDQPVYFKGILRQRDDVAYTPVAGVTTIPITVYDIEQQIIYETQADLTPFGTFSGQFDLDLEAGLGYYRIVATLPFEPQTDFYREYSVGFNVAEYRAPEFQVTVTPAVQAVVQGDTIQVDVESRYFFGAPVSNANIVWNVVGNNYYFNYQGPGTWQFIDYNYDDGPRSFYDPEREVIANGEGVTDSQGRFMVEVPAELGEKTQSQIYTIEAVITDESNQVVAGRTEVIVHQGDFYIGISPDEYVGTAGQETGFRVLTVDWDSESFGGQSVDYRVVERRWSSVQERDLNGRTIWSYEVEEIEIDSGSVTTDLDGTAHVNFTPPNGGTFKIYAVARDERGNTINSSAFIWVSGNEYVAWRQQNSNRIDLITNADEYKIGDTAEILIASPFQGETVALVTIERGDILTTEVIQMPTNSYIYRVPIEEIHAPNIYISVILVKGIDENNPYTQFRMGMAQLNVETSRLTLNLEVTPDLPEGETAGPGDTVTLNVTTTDWAGNPVGAEVGISVSDLAVLSISQPNTMPLLDFFYGQKGVSVRTATPLTVSVDQVTQTIIDTIKGGGGGGAESGIFDVRQDFVDTPLWEPTLVTNQNGQGQVTITLPDNLTTWRIDARAITSGQDGPMLVGQITRDFVSTKPLLIRPVTPRFMVVDDILTFGAIVNNNTESEQVVDVLLEGTGFMVLNDVPLTQTVTIPAGGRARVDWPVQALDVSFVDVFFATQNQDGSLQDASKPPLGQGDDRLLPVYKYAAPETVGTSGVLEGTEGVSFTEVIALPSRIDESRGKLEIRLDRSLAGPALDGLSYLVNYPHQSIETTVSSFLPNIVTIRALQAFNQSNPDLENRLRTQINFGLQRLYAQQKVDGGWGWFPNDVSNPVTTAYGLIGLAEAQRAGYTVDANVIQRAQGFLNGYLLQTEGSLSTAESWLLNRRAFILYALAISGEGNASRMSSLFDLRERMNFDAKAYLMLAMWTVDANDARLDTLASDFTGSAILSASGTYWQDASDTFNWTTNTRTTALVLKALLVHDANNALLPGAVRWLMVARTADAWETTQETAWAIMSLSEWMMATGELLADYNFAVRLNDELLEISDNTASAENVKENEQLTVEVAELLKDEANRLVFIKEAGPGSLYYTAHITSYQDVATLEPISRGVIVSRQYHLAGDEQRVPVTTAKVGDEIVVTLTIIAPNDLHYVVVEDPIPAGAEAVDPNLLTESILSEGPELQRDDPLSRGWGWWWFARTEFRDEKVVMYATFLPRGTYTYTYTLRLGLAGEYNVIPTTGREFYFPEVYGRGAGMKFSILPAEEE